MLDWLARRRSRKRTAQNLYGSIVALARQPALYEGTGVPDTVEGRFEILILHIFIFLERLRREGEGSAGLAQSLVDEFFADMDTTNRELGVGDLSVPRKMHHLAAVYAQRLRGYSEAIDSRRNDRLSGLIAENLELQPSDKNATGDRLAQYTRKILAASSSRSA